MGRERVLDRAHGTPACRQGIKCLAHHGTRDPDRDEETIIWCAGAAWLLYALAQRVQAKPRYARQEWQARCELGSIHLIVLARDQRLKVTVRSGPRTKLDLLAMGVLGICGCSLDRAGCLYAFQTPLRLGSWRLHCCSRITRSDVVRYRDGNEICTRKRIQVPCAIGNCDFISRSLGTFGGWNSRVNTSLSPLRYAGRKIHLMVRVSRSDEVK